jgi:hypothetical protein
MAAVMAAHLVKPSIDGVFRVTHDHSAPGNG